MPDSELAKQIIGAVKRIDKAAQAVKRAAVDMIEMAKELRDIKKDEEEKGG